MILEVILISIVINLVGFVHCAEFSTLNLDVITVIKDLPHAQEIVKQEKLYANNVVEI